MLRVVVRGKGRQGGRADVNCCFWDAPQQQVKYSLCEEVRTDEFTGVRTDKLVYRGRFLPKKKRKKVGAIKEVVVLAGATMTRKC